MIIIPYFYEEFNRFVFIFARSVLNFLLDHGIIQGDFNVKEDNIYGITRNG